ncbi:hypothetical protein [Bradyrhizobium sp. STM 3557]
MTSPHTGLATQGHAAVIRLTERALALELVAICWRSIFIRHSAPGG